MTVDANRLRDLRKKHKLTTAELGLLVGVAQQQVSRYESGDVGMNTETLKRLAQTFGVSSDYLLGLSDSPRPAEKPSTLTWRIDTTTALEKFTPERIAQVVKAFGIRVEPNPLVIDEKVLLDLYSPMMVARFLKELGLRFELAEPDDSPDS